MPNRSGFDRSAMPTAHSIELNNMSEETTMDFIFGEVKERKVLRERAKLQTESVSSSEEFDFLVGPERTKFTIRSALLQQISRPLHAMMNGIMREAKERNAVLEDVAADTFLILVDFAYRYARLDNDDFKLCDHESCFGSFPIAPTSWCCSDCSGLRCFLESCAQDQQGGRTAQLDIFRSKHLYQDITTPSAPGRGRWKIDDTVTPSRSLLSSAELYVFADKYLIEGLKIAALYQIYGDLVNIHYKGFRTDVNSCQSMGDLVRLLRYVYQYWSDSDRKDQDCVELKRLVLDFVVCKRETIVPREEYRALIFEIPTIALDFMDVLNILSRSPHDHGVYFCARKEHWSDEVEEMRRHTERRLLGEA